MVIELHVAISFSLSEINLCAVALFEAPKYPSNATSHLGKALAEHALDPSSPEIDVDTQNNKE
jgi:hypothetical protein